MNTKTFMYIKLLVIDMFFVSDVFVMHDLSPVLWNDVVAFCQLHM